MNESIRPKPLCLVTISGLDINDLTNLLFKMPNFKSLITHYPFLVLSSSQRNVSRFHNSYRELGSGSSAETKSDISLAQVISDTGLSQLHIANVESYAYVSYYFNNKNKQKHENEDWKKVDNSSVSEGFKSNRLTKKLFQEMNRQYYDFIFVDYNDLLISSDKGMALAILDKQISNLVDLVLSFNGAILISSNSGLNKLDNRVPLFMISKFWKNKSFIDFDYSKKINEQSVHGDITQISPTILKILGISKPQKMNTNSLI